MTRKGRRWGSIRLAAFAAGNPPLPRRVLTRLCALSAASIGRCLRHNAVRHDLRCNQPVEHVYPRVLKKEKALGRKGVAPLPLIAYKYVCTRAHSFALPGRGTLADGECRSQIPGLPPAHASAIFAATSPVCPPLLEHPRQSAARAENKRCEVGEQRRPLR